MVARHFQQVSREIDIMKRINRLGVVQIYGTFQDSKMIYIVQEYCSRGDLFNRLMDRGGMLSEAEVAAKVVTPMLISLAKMHALNILHRDIKWVLCLEGTGQSPLPHLTVFFVAGAACRPENIFIDGEDRIRLGDFGLSIDSRRERAVSRIGTVRGGYPRERGLASLAHSPAPSPRPAQLDYMSPEVIAMPAEQDPSKGPVKTYDDKVDVWAVGILAYECIAGRPPFEVEDERQTTFLIVTAQISSFPPQFSSLAIDFIQQSLRKDPRQRPSAAKLLQHPWVFAHYKRYVEETGEDVIGFWGQGAPKPSVARGPSSRPTSQTGASQQAGPKSLPPKTGPAPLKPSPGPAGKGQAPPTPGQNRISVFGKSKVQPSGDSESASSAAGEEEGGRKKRTSVMTGMFSRLFQKK